MYKINYILFLIPLYCVILFESFIQDYLIAFSIFLSVLLFNSFIIFSKKYSNFKVFLYTVCCSILFPFGLLLINGEIGITWFIVVWVILLFLFIARNFIEYNLEFLYGVCLFYSIVFSAVDVYLDLESNYFKCLVYSGVLHLICYPNFKKFVLFKAVKKSSKKSKKIRDE